MKRWITNIQWKITSSDATKWENEDKNGTPQREKKMCYAYYQYSTVEHELGIEVDEMRDRLRAHNCSTLTMQFAMSLI